MGNMFVKMLINIIICQRKVLIYSKTILFTKVNGTVISEKE